MVLQFSCITNKFTSVSSSDKSNKVLITLIDPNPEPHNHLYPNLKVKKYLGA